MYSYEDETGIVHFTDKTTDKRFKRLVVDLHNGYRIKLGPFGSYSAARIVNATLINNDVDSAINSKTLKEYFVYIGEYSTSKIAKLEANKLLNKKLIDEYEITAPIKNTPNKDINTAIRRPYKDKSTEIGREIIKLEKIFNNRRYIGIKDVVTNCGVINNTPELTIGCSMYFSEPYSIRNDYFKFNRSIREKESIVVRAIHDYARAGKFSLNLEGIYNGGPLCRYQYSYSFMKVYRIHGID
jgi:hypothetical protein